ncbi:MAG: hypothetical protein EPN60_12075 [Nevskiaceae bacterium]|nr:MAG: hypothetical protein EPO48_13395 [Nevskiaceae bacterium]TAM25544.1 MAG: hypothetical protein EPN60_12075 [Nevskiaceae bacterium]
MQTPDFAQLGHPPLPARDLNFLFERFPGKIDVARAITEVGQFFNTLDSMLDADYVYAALRDADTLDLPVSPQLWFEVMLRNALPGRRNRQEQQALHYIAHLLALFSRAERLRRVQDGDETAYDYLVDLVMEEQAADASRRFVVQAHIANYSLFLGGVCAEWVEHRHRYKRRPVTLGYYRDMGASRFHMASRHPLADEFGLTATYRELAQRFDYYRGGLEKMAAEHLYN